MTPAQWQTFKHAALGDSTGGIPLALIVDSPWLPGHLGLNHLDFYLDPDIWFRAHQKIHDEFPGVLFVPPFWTEFGMAAEPSALGAKIKFWPDNTPGETPALLRIEDIAEIPAPDPERDAFAALTLHRICMTRERVFAAGHTLPLAAARGPLCTAAFARGTTALMLDLVENPGWARRLLDVCADFVIAWLRAQARALGPAVEGFLLLDDIVGFLGPDHYEEFCHPLLKRICDAFPAHWLKIYHNDASIDVCLERLPDAGFHVLNWGKQTPVAEVRARVGRRLCLMGNVNPLEVAVRGTPGQVRAATLEVLANRGEGPFILSTGGGVSPGMPAENIHAMQEALAEYNGRKAAGSE
jgi:uroporphyrinogen decarboxylase